MFLNPVNFLKATNGFERISPSIVPGQRLFFDEDWNVVFEPCRFLSETYELGRDTHDTHSSYGYALEQFFVSCNESDVSWKDITYSDLLAYRRILLKRYSFNFWPVICQIEVTPPYFSPGPAKDVRVRDKFASRMARPIPRFAAKAPPYRERFSRKNFGHPVRLKFEVTGIEWLREVHYRPRPFRFRNPFLHR